MSFARAAPIPLLPPVMTDTVPTSGLAALVAIVVKLVERAVGGKKRG